MSVATKGWFRGGWRIERTIDDRYSGQTGSLQGEARFSDDPHGLAYRETGQLQLGGRTFAAERRYLWRFRPNGRISILFDDQRPFHSFIPGRPVADHLCGEDRYAVVYEFGDDAWQARWDVRGPHKAYTMVTHYRRG